MTNTYVASHMADPRHPGIMTRYGPDGGELARGAMAAIAELLPADGECYLGLRYHLNPDAADPASRLRVFFRFEGASSTEEDIAGEHLIRPFLKLKPSRPADAYDDLSEDAVILNVVPAEQLVRLPDSRILYFLTDAEADRSGEVVAMVLDDLFDTLRRPCAVDILVGAAALTPPELNALSGEIVFAATEGSQYDPEHYTAASIDKLRRATDPVAVRCERSLQAQLDRACSMRCYRVEIRVVSPDPIEAQLVARTMGRLLSPKGHFTIVEHSGEKAWASFREFAITPPYESWEDRPLRSAALTPDVISEIDRRNRERAARLATLAGMADVVDSHAVSRLLCLPVTDGEYLKTIALDTEEEPWDPAVAAIVLGVMFLRRRQVRILVQRMAKHIAIFGSTGFGKSNIVRLILLQLWRDYGIPFLVIEPAKAETRQLLSTDPSLAEHLRVFTAGDEASIPLRINPLEVPPNVTVDEHVAVLLAALQGVLSTGGAIDSVLGEALHECYHRAGIRGYTKGRDIDIFPTLRDLTEAVTAVIALRGYAPEVESNINGATKGRIDTLCQGVQAPLFVCERSLPTLPSLLEHPTVVELHALNEEARNLTTLLLLLALRQHLRTLGPSKDLRLVIVIEEAHNLAAAPAPGTNPEIGDPKGHATRLLVSLLAEVRSYGVCVIVADQSPALLAPEVLKHTGTKIVGRPNDQVDRQIAAETIVLDPIRHGELAVLRPGEFFLFHEGLFRPVRILADYVEEADTSLHGRALTDHLAGASWYQDASQTRLKADCELLLKSLRSFLTQQVKQARGGEWPPQARDAMTTKVEECADMIGVLCSRCREASASNTWLDDVETHYRERFQNLVTEAARLFDEVAEAGAGEK